MTPSPANNPAGATEPSSTGFGAATDRLSVALADRYRIERHLGAGGMATVYLAQDLKHDRKVAIKVLKPELAAVLGAERFVVEIKTTAALQHPHILPLFDSGSADGFLYYVMPFVEGETLRDKLNRETQVGIAEAVRITREVADALDYAHRHGVIHRDIKPENILLHDGRPVVADFGIALAVSAAAGGRMTETGLSLGTPHYMSPEQATADKAITARSDIYSLGSVLYEMLTGDPPHTGSSAQQIIMKIIAEPAQAVTTYRKSVPANVGAAVARALEKVPADRFESAKAFGDALANPAFVTSAATTVGAAGAASSRFSRASASAIAAALLVAGATAGAIIGRRTAPVAEPPVAQFYIELPDSIVSVNSCCGPAQVISRDGSTFVFVGARGTTRRLYRRSIDALHAEPIPGTDGGASPAISPDGRWVAFEVDGQLKKVPIAGGPVVTIANIGGAAAGATWVSNDTILFSNSRLRLSLWLVGASGGQPFRVPGMDTTAAYRYPSMLPGGRHALVQWRPPTGEDIGAARVIAVDLKTGQVDTVVAAATAQYALGHLVIGSADGTILVQPFDPGTLRTTGPATALPGRAASSANILPEFAVSDNGWLEYEVSRGAGGTKTLRILDGRDAPVMFESAPLTGNFEDVAISPDGNRILYRLSTSVFGAGGDLWLLDLKAGTRSQFTVGGGTTPVWTPDGSRVAYYYHGDSTTKAGVYIRPIDQNSAPQLVAAGLGLIPNSFTPDGHSLAVGTGFLQPTIADIGTVTLGDTAVKWILKTEFAERQPQISRDGKRLAYTSNRTGRPEVYVQAMSGEAVPVLVSTNGGTSPRWARDGRLFYVDPSGQIVAVTMQPGPGIVVTSRAIASRGASNADLNNANVNWDLFPDGRMLIIDIAGTGQGTRRIAMIQNWRALARQMGAKR
jgi:serine/threonine-protein kinase